MHILPRLPRRISFGGLGGWGDGGVTNNVFASCVVSSQLETRS